VATDSIHKPARTPWLPAIIDFASASHGRAAAVLVVVALLAFVPGFFQIQPVDRDEARFAQATKQMIESGDYVDIRFQDEARYKKPVGIYWLQAAAVKFGERLGVPRAHTTIALYRIPSLLGAIGGVLLTYWAALAFVSRRAAFLAGLMMAASILLGVEARLAKTDAMLLLTCAAAMGALGRAYLGQREQDNGGLSGWAVPAIFWSALAGGILLKGPLILMFIALTIVTLAILDRPAGWPWRLKADWLWRLRPLPGVLWMFLLVLPWFIAIMARNGWSFFSESIGHDLAAKVGGAQETHGAPPGYYLTLATLSLWPATLYVLPSLRAALARRSTVVGSGPGNLHPQADAPDRTIPRRVASSPRPCGALSRPLQSAPRCVTPDSATPADSAAPAQSPAREFGGILDRSDQPNRARRIESHR